MLPREHLLSGTPPSVLSSHSILAVLSKDEDDESSSSDEQPNLFEQLDVMSSIARKVQESISADRPSISRPCREAKELLSSF